ncbi:conjugal transfer protein TraI [Burkholderia stagnalis]|uniref:TraB/VirB10 family protein n=1 Tax=Burkholderia stagnalis TaxID=1503054 RepID=UPI000F5D56ED|nr:TraB/VirB10 family protein [Burkholderia stagnalis]RQX95008.1 conjugal transfer protein TraI [Burkholderia stagnalis]RQY32561.1 conjugal transfer protein TraI [Burkholderia stagnalis]RQY49629.1 conjugal transfer protein TraI [Burkholderia stagnalis]RQY56569.1 conjugal transfer protein TraI [Burkholderia stagnalis]RQY86341.1 conjugal transfer protein TraI [Burkholderia stagnalis]
MSDTRPSGGSNDQTKRRQRLVVIGAVVVIVAITGVGLMLTDETAPPPKPKPITQAIQQPGTIDDRDAWRTKSAATLADLEQRVQRQQARLEEQQASIEKMASAAAAQQASAAVAASLAAAASSAAAPAAAGAATPASSATGATTLNKPLPVTARGLGGKQVLPPPGGTLAQRIDGSDVPPRQLEIISFVDDGSGSGADSANAAGSSGGKSEVLGFPTDPKARRYATTKGTNAAASSGGQGLVNILPAGSFFRVGMLNGVDAPTGGQAQSDPLSVDLHALEAANLPNRKRLDLRDCRVVAATWGDLSSERMMGRTQTLSCILEGKSIEIPIKGKLIGEDGKEGVRGRLVTKQGQLLANAILSGTLGGIGQAFQQSATVTSIGGGGISQTVDSGQIGRAAIGGGVGSAGQMLAQYYLKAADKLYPVIETDATRTIEVSITQGTFVDASTAALFDRRDSSRRSGDRSRRLSDD